MTEFTGTQKINFGDRLGQDWYRLADYFGIPPKERRSFDKGLEEQRTWEWLESHNCMHQLREAVTFIGRQDLLIELAQSDAETCTGKDDSVSEWQGSPYPGLHYFREEDSRVFCGRERETQRLCQRIIKDRFVVVVGASGSGKSSLVSAGLIPELKRQPGGQDWRYIRFTPGGITENPFAAVAARLEPLLEADRIPARDIVQSLQSNGKIEEYVIQILKHQPENAELLLFVDQFEELFTLVKPVYQNPFLLMLCNAANTPRLRTVLTVRVDFYDRCLASEQFAGLLETTSFLLTAPGLPALYEMITKPAAIAGLEFDPELPALILEDTGSRPGSLALMAFALAELYQASGAGGRLTRAAYDSFGGVKGVIGTIADREYCKLKALYQEEGKERIQTLLLDDTFDEVFKELVDVDPQTNTPTRRRVVQHFFADKSAALRLINVFTDARLFRTDTGDEHAPTLEVAHDALFSQWEHLKEWIEERIDDFRLLRQVKLETAEWVRQGRKESHLWRHERLEPVYVMEARLKPDLSRDEREFIRHEADRLLEEIESPATSYQRREIIGDRLADIGDLRPGVGLNRDDLPDIVWLPVPPGDITLEGTGTFNVKPCFISKYPITYAQYRCFLQAEDGYQDNRWWGDLVHLRKPGEQYRKQDSHPAENVSWYDVAAFCRWLCFKTGKKIRLPTEWEWQQAATGGNATREYPWPGEWNGDFSNTLESGLNRTTAVGLFPQGVSPIGALDMSGNVSEWCLNEYDNPDNTAEIGTGSRVLRGGSWYDSWEYARASCRYFNYPGYRNYYCGFRVLEGPPPSQS